MRCREQSALNGAPELWMDGKESPGSPGLGGSYESPNLGEPIHFVW